VAALLGNVQIEAQNCTLNLTIWRYAEHFHFSVQIHSAMAECRATIFNPSLLNLSNSKEDSKLGHCFKDTAKCVSLDNDQRNQE
jgi:hypothetical protein